MVRSIRLILDAMSDAQTASQRAASMNSPFRRPTTARSPSPDMSLPTLDSEHLKLKMRLSPLIHVEETLIQKLTPSGSTEFEATHLAPVTNIPFAERMRGRGGEVAVNSQFQWKNLFGRLMSNTRDSIDTNEGVDWEDSQVGGILQTLKLLMEYSGPRSHYPRMRRGHDAAMERSYDQSFA